MVEGETSARLGLNRASLGARWPDARGDGQGMVLSVRMGSQRDTLCFEMFGHGCSEELRVG